MNRRVRSGLAVAAVVSAAVLALAAVFAAYRNPHLMVQLSNAFWSCF
jgi:hypothetical protein